jgi:DNA-binding LytR/AlgR family response regulator
MGMFKALKAVIVEDEEGPRLSLKRLLQRRHADVIEIVAEADTGTAALALCEEHQPDVIFLDLHLPGLNGFDLLSQLRTEAHVIITTGDSQHAVEAYRANAIDYLLKPVDPDQLKEAIHRVTSAIANERMVRLLCRDRDSVRVVPLEDVLFLRADGGYTSVQTEDTYHLLPDALATIEERLPEYFVRVHRTTIVNVRQVKSLGNDSALVGLRGIEVAISRRHLREFRRSLMYEK